jgi:hypothetical protein
VKKMMNSRAFKVLQSQSGAILQKSISATLNAKMEELKDYERHLLDLGQSFKEMQEDELLKDSEFRQKQIAELQQVFQGIRDNYLTLYGNLRVIGDAAVIMN